MNRDTMINIDNAFKVLKENPHSFAAVEILQNCAADIFSYKFTVYTVDSVNTPIFFMSVYPERSTIDKIVESISKNEPHVISKLWTQTKEWIIEIDSRILDRNVIDLSDRELTAIFCHEIGHIIRSNSIPNRLVTILQYELAKTSIGNKAVIKEKIFRKLLSLPILNACMGSDHESASLKEEIRADKFVKKMGYQSDLISVFKKYQSRKQFGDENKDMRKMAAFSLSSLDQFKKREVAMLEQTIDRMIQECGSIYVKSMLEEIHDDYFSENANGSVTKDKRLNYLFERVNQLEEEFIATEFFGIDRRNLKRIDPGDLDYVAVKLQEIKTVSDKMMLVSYIHSKLDIIHFYISLYENPKPNKKYNIPHTLKELEMMRKYLNQLLQEVINAKLPDRFRNGLLVAWPDGYEG